MTEEFYTNRYLRGTWLGPLGLVLAQSVEVLFRGPIMILVAVAVAVWLSGLVFGWNPTWPNLSDPRNILRTIAIWSVAGAMAVLCVAWFVHTWVRFGSILRARAYVASGLPLLSAQGPARFSGGSQGSRQSASYSPISLEIGGHFFDLVACAHRHELEAVKQLSYVRSESDPRGSVVGFKIETPFRVWYTPSGVIVSADIEVPDAYLDPARRGEFLKEKWINARSTGLSSEQRQRIGERLAHAEELAQQRRGAMSSEELEEADERIKKLQKSFQKLGTRKR